jgi:glycosyltransferase involved in cell wall biosynthesis
MNNKNIDNYMSSYLRDEFSLERPFLSNGDVDQKYIELSDLLNRQDQIIKILSKQKSTQNVKGVSLKWLEFKNTIWRLIVGDINEITREVIFKYKLSFFKNKLIKLYENHSQSSVIDTSSVDRLIIDVTNTLNCEFLSGIQRVVNEISTHLISSNVYYIFLLEDAMYTYDIQQQRIVSFDFKPNDIFLMLDSSIDYRKLIALAMKKNRIAGGYNVSVVYDIIPNDYPLICGASIPYKFHMWLKECVLDSDLVLCNSHTVKCKLEFVLKQLTNASKNIPAVDYFYLGSDSTEKKINKNSSKIEKIFEKNKIVFISVGTIEPRKAYSIALDAAEAAWRNGDDFIYIIVGRYGWFQSKIRDRILNHNEINNRLYWFEDLDDTDLESLYLRSRALVYTSIDEGFGLPLIEAAKYKLPAIVSDIEVFREIANHEAAYFDVADSAMLAQRINEFCYSPKSEPNISFISWQMSATILFTKIKNLYLSKLNLNEVL